MSEHDPKSYEAAQGKINTLYAALTLSNEANRRLEAKVEELKRELKIANTFAVSRRKVIADLKAKVDGWKAQDAEGNRLLAKERAKVEELTAENRQLNTSLDSIIDNVPKLQAEVDALKEQVQAVYSAGMRGISYAQRSDYTGRGIEDRIHELRAALKPEGRLERSLSRSTAFPASQAALKQEGGK